jgi:hypothetical protein
LAGGSACPTTLARRAEVRREGRSPGPTKLDERGCMGLEMPATAVRAPSRVARWQTINLALLVVGYSGYYLCRSNLSVTLPLIIQELVRKGMDANAARVALGSIASLGVLAYAIGKFPSGKPGRLVWRAPQFLVRHERQHRVHTAIRGFGSAASVHAGVDGEPVGAIVRLGRGGEDRVAMVPVSPVRDSDGDYQPQLSVWRCGGAAIHGALAGGRFRLAGRVRHRRGRAHRGASRVPVVGGVAVATGRA